MSRTNLDFLFQVTGPSTDRGFSAVLRGDEVRPAFDEHLTKASATPSGSSTASNSDDRPLASGATSSDYQASASEPAHEETAATDAAATDRDDTDAHESRDSAEFDTTLANRAGDAEDVSAEAVDDPKIDDDETDELNDATAVAVEANGKTAAAENSAKLQESVAASDLMTHEQTAGAIKERLSHNPGLQARAAAEKALVGVPEQTTSDATSETANDATASGDVVHGTASTKASKKSREAKATNAKTEGQAPHGKQSSDEAELIQLNGEVSDSAGRAKTTEEAATDDPQLNGPGQSDESDNKTTGDEETARSAARERGDAAALTGKVAAVVNGVATQSDHSALPADANKGVGKVGKAGTTKIETIADAANRLHANQAGAKRGALTSEADELPRVDPARFIDRVAKAFHTAQERGGMLQIRLSPPELGAMRLELSVKDGVMSAALETESAAARRVLLEHLPALRERLAEQNIRVERFDVDVRREGAGGQADPRATHDQQQSQQGHSERRQPATPQRAASTPRINTVPVQPASPNSGINLVA